MRICREGDKSKGELALDGVGNADDAGLGYKWMGGNGLLDTACEYC